MEKLQAIMKSIFGKGGKSCCRNTMLHQKPLGKIFTAFELCAFMGGADNGNVFQPVVLQKKINDTVNKGVFGTGNDHINFIIEHELTDGRKIGWFYIDVVSAEHSTGIARSDKKIFAERTLGKFKGKGMLAPTGTEQKDVH